VIIRLLGDEPSALLEVAERPQHGPAAVVLDMVIPFPPVAWI
jgi:hypothetical protein